MHKQTGGIKNEQHIHFYSRIGSSFPAVETETEADANGQRYGRKITETIKIGSAAVLYRGTVSAGAHVDGSQSVTS